MVVSSIKLPSNPGCQHINFVLEDENGKSKCSYHLSDFLSDEPTIEGDPIYDALRKKASGKKTRDDIFSALLHFSF